VLRLAVGNLRTTEAHVRRAWDLLRDHASRLRWKAPGCGDWPAWARPFTTPNARIFSSSTGQSAARFTAITPAFAVRPRAPGCVSPAPFSALARVCAGDHGARPLQPSRMVA